MGLWAVLGRSIDTWELYVLLNRSLARLLQITRSLLDVVSEVASDCLQGKKFQFSYFSTNDELVTFPVPPFGGSVFYMGTLNDPDWMEPEW